MTDNIRIFPLWTLGAHLTTSTSFHFSSSSGCLQVCPLSSSSCPSCPMTPLGSSHGVSAGQGGADMCSSLQWCVWPAQCVCWQSVGAAPSVMLSGGFGRSLVTRDYVSLCLLWQTGGAGWHLICTNAAAWRPVEDGTRLVSCHHDDIISCGHRSVDKMPRQ